MQFYASLALLIATVSVNVQCAPSVVDVDAVPLPTDAPPAPIDATAEATAADIPAEAPPADAPAEIVLTDVPLGGGQIEQCLQESALHGNCGSEYERYTYDSTLKMCVRFRYGGCGGNDNNFDNYLDCFHQCEKFINEPPVMT